MTATTREARSSAINLAGHLIVISVSAVSFEGRARHIRVGSSLRTVRLTQHPDQESLAMRRGKAGWSTDDLLQIATTKVSESPFAL
jgi:hypothetical protein